MIICPTPEQCSNNDLVSENDYYNYFGCWYPQMGGYVGRALVEVPKEPESNNDCFDVYIWHDGEFPFDGDQDPIRLHHCDYKQFIRFGLKVRQLQKEAGGKNKS